MELSILLRLKESLKTSRKTIDDLYREAYEEGFDLSDSRREFWHIFNRLLTEVELMLGVQK